MFPMTEGLWVQAKGRKVYHCHLITCIYTLVCAIET